jgi:hypothetical protein
MVPNRYLRQEMAQLIVTAFQDGAAAITGTELAHALLQRGIRVEHATALTTLEALELRNCVQLLRSADEDVVTAIYPAIKQFL